ncbi:MAG: hypothetical protein AAGA10_16380 [Bacteroidota bacterium]
MQLHMGILRIVTVLLFLGKAWQHLRWGTPNDQLPYGTYLDSLFVFVYLVCAVLVGGLHKKVSSGVVHLFIYLGVTFLLSQTCLSFAQSGWEIPQLIEHTLQWSIPLFWLYQNYVSERPTQRITYFMLVAIALTFLGHGLYAAGVWTQPTHFIGMTRSILGISVPQAQQFLLVAGILDFCVVVGIFFLKVRNPFLIYALIWGTLTALARIVAHWEWDNPVDSFDRWGFEVAYRLGHGGIPFLVWWNRKINE